MTAAIMERPRTGSVADDPQWRLRAACLGMDPAVFFDGGGLARRAKKTCVRCPVRRPCLEAGLSNDEQFGIWGGLTRDERRELGTTGD